jgi:putative transposase
MGIPNKLFLFVHAIWRVNDAEPCLSKSIRKVLFAHLLKQAAENGINIMCLNGVEDHVHCLLRLQAAQNLAQVMKSIKTNSAEWLNGTKLLAGPFEWEEGFAAYSVSPSGVKAVMDYIEKQEDWHLTRTLEDELKIFEEYHF